MSKNLVRIISGILLAGSLAIGGCAGSNVETPPLTNYPVVASSSQDTTQSREIEQSDLFSATRYESMGDLEQNEQEKIAYYKLALNTLLFHNERNDEKIERLCEKLGDITQDEVYDSLANDIAKNFDAYSGFFDYFRGCDSFIPVGPFFETRAVAYVIKLPTLPASEIRPLPACLFYSNKEKEVENHMLYTPLETISDSSDLIKETREWIEGVISVH